MDKIIRIIYPPLSKSHSILVDLFVLFPLLLMYVTASYTQHMG